MSAPGILVPLGCGPRTSVSPLTMQRNPYPPAELGISAALLDNRFDHQGIRIEPLPCPSIQRVDMFQKRDKERQGASAGAATVELGGPRCPSCKHYLGVYVRSGWCAWGWCPWETTALGAGVVESLSIAHRSWGSIGSTARRQRASGLRD